MRNISACPGISRMTLQKHRYVMRQSLLVREFRDMAFRAREFPR